MTVQRRALPAALQAVAALVIAAFFFVGLTPTAAQASPATAAVTVHVATKAGTPLSGMNVYAYPVQNHAVIGDGIVADYVAAGTFRFSDTTTSDPLSTAVQYALYFDAPGSATTAFDQFWGGTTFVEEARYWDFAGDGTDLTATLATNSVLTGTVMRSGGTRLSGVPVRPWRWDGNSWFRLDRASTTTSSTGVYTIRNLEPGTYKIEFAPANTTGYLSRFSAPVTLGLGSVISSNATLATGATLSGAVQLYDEVPAGSGTIQKVQSNDITARAYPVSGGVIDTSVSYASTPTGADGKWVIRGLPSGQYKVKVYDTYDPSSPAYVDEWLPNADHVVDAATYTVTAGKGYATGVVTRMDFFQHKAVTSLQLNVTAHDGAPAPDNTTVYIASTSGEDFSAYFALVGGTTSFAFLPTGSYDVYVDSPDPADGPQIASQTITAGAANTWNIALPAASAFSYVTPASISPGATVAGTTYTVNHGATSLPDSKVQYSYIWLRDDVPVFGAQSSTSNAYQSRGADVGTRLSVIVRADAFGYDPVFSTVVAADPVTTGAAPVSDPADPPQVRAPATPVPGSVLTADVGGWSTGGLTFAYQWFRDGGALTGATARTYTVQPGDAGHAITFQVTASRVGYLPATAESEDAVVIDMLTAPRLTRSPAVRLSTSGASLRLSTSAGSWSPVPSTFQFEWFADGLPQASTPTADCSLSPGACAPGSAIELRITATRTGYAPSVRTFLVRKGTALPAATTPGFVYDDTAAGDPALASATDPAWVSHALRVSAPVYTYPGDGNGGTVRTSYQWQRLIGTKWYNIYPASKTAYVPTTSDVNRQLRLRIITTSTRYGTKVEYLVAGKGSVLMDLRDTPATVEVGGSDAIGAYKYASVGAWPVGGVSQRYQWYGCSPALDCSGQPGTNANWKAISRATSSVYKPTVPIQLIVRVVGSRSGHATAVVYSAPRSFAGTDTIAYARGARPMITSGIAGGQAAVGRTLVGRAGVVDRSTGVVRSYQWRVCEGASGACVDVPGATSTTVTPTSDWLGMATEPWVEFTESVGLVGNPDQVQGESVRYPLVPGTIAPLVAPKITVAAGPVYTVAPGTWPSGTGVTYQWYNGATATGTGTSYTDPGGTNPIVLVIHTTRDGYTPRDFIYVARKGTLPAQPGISGARYGDTLSATSFTVPSWSESLSKRWQWYLGSKAIYRKTAGTFLPSTSYVGKSIKVRVILTSPYWNTAIYYTPYVKLGSHVAASGTPVIRSSLTNPSPGSKLTVNLSSFPSGMSYTYAWQRSADGGATWATATTASSYTVSTSDVTKQIRVVVVARRTGWLSASSVSAAVTVGYAPALALTAPFVLSGPGVVDTTLAAPTSWNTSDYALTYTWTRNGVTIPGATGASVTPTASWFGDEVQAHVTATKAGYEPVTVHSNEVRVGAGAAPTSAAPAVSLSGDVLTSSAGVWSVAGVTIEYAWYDETADPGHASPLGTAAAFTVPASGSYTVVVTAKRDGYAPGTVSRTVVVP